MKLPILLLAVCGLAACAHDLDDGTSATGATAEAERALAVEARAPRRHLGNLGRGGVYDN